MVFYRKYRPQKIEEIDSEQVRVRLSALLSKKELSHAFLFYGPKGLGKTSLARILAKIVNCEKLKGIEPCNKCQMCLSITNGINLDVLEIDAASNRGIDEIRDLREKIRLAPLRAKKKVYIIDEAHMLTREAFNALLKTLEEPPQHVMFILCTTEQDKLPDTIASRCVAVNFKKATDNEIARSLARIIRVEKINIDKDAVLKIAKISDGSFRDGTKILEQILALSGRKKITQEFIEREYQSPVKLTEFLQSLLAKDLKQTILLLEREIQEGKDAKVFAEELLNLLHSLVLKKVGIEKEVDEQLLEKVDISELKKLVELMEKAAGEVKNAVVPQLPIELAIIEYCALVAQVAPLGGAPLAQDDLLKKLVDKVKPLSNSLAGVLRGCRIGKLDGETLILETKYKFHKEKLDNLENIKILKAVSRDIFGREVNIKCLIH